MGKSFEETGGAEIVDHVEQRHLYAVGESVVVGELTFEICLESGEDRAELCVDRLLGQDEGGWSFVERRSSTHRHSVDASIVRGDLFRCRSASADEEGECRSGFGVGQHQPYPYRDLAYRIAIHPRYAAFKLFQLCERLL